MSHMSLGRVWLSALAAVLLAACGHGNDAAPASHQGPPENKAPHAGNDRATTTADHAVRIDVLANDNDPNGNGDINPASVTVAGLTHGTASVDPATGAVTFTPAPGYVGGASFTYTV